ncbi:hypothetical protein J6590_078483 [Homalodisca vitripennis]|nr:hypothetical protein J6590_078483 [Homalodisca vitripennis]
MQRLESDAVTDLPTSIWSHVSVKTSKKICDECLTITADTFNLCIKCGHNLSRIIRINRAKEQKNQVKQQYCHQNRRIKFSELNLTGEELKYLDEIEENQEHNIGNILAVPNLSESPRPPATPSISQEHNINNILAVPDLSESPRLPATPSGPSEQSEDIISKSGL